MKENVLYTIDEFLKSKSSLKNKCIALSIAIQSEKDKKEIERLNNLLKMHLSWMQAQKAIAEARKQQKEWKAINA